MSEKTRAEHLEWCKQRANAYLDKGDIENAFSSMLSDVGKHPETRDHKATEMMMLLKMSGQLNTVQEMRRYINGFN